MLDHPNITCVTGTEYTAVDRAAYDQLIFTGPIDEFFGYRYGKLPYRSLQFRHETHDTPWFQDVGVVNHPAEDVPFTRVTEFKHLTGQAHARTSVCYEFPAAEGDPYYPVPRPENAALYRQYQALADAKAQNRVKADISTATANGYARLIFHFAEDVESDVRLANGVLVIKFKRPIDVALDAISADGLTLLSPSVSGPISSLPVSLRAVVGAR